MAKFSHEPIIEAACQNGGLPGVVLTAGDATGKFQYAKAFGQNARGETLALDSVMWIASNTKIVTAVAALQQVEKGKIGLDDDITKVIPEIASLQVLAGFEEGGKPIYEDRKFPLTLRILLTHTSGFTHPLFNAKLQQLEKYTGPLVADSRTILGDCTLPLVCQPGESWEYGLSYDVAGKLIERLSGLSLEDYMRANVWDPLDMPLISFVPDSKPEMKARMIKSSTRAGPGKLVPGDMYFHQLGGDKDDAYGGAGLWASADTYAKLLHSLCANDGRVLGKEMADELFRPQLRPDVREALNETARTVEAVRQIYANSFDMDHQIIDQALGGMVGTRDEPDRKRAGTMAWGGFPNLIWWVDRKAGLWGSVFTNLVPAGDVEATELAAVFERSIYEQYEEFKKQNA
ncbi:beta-lactamase family protein [Hypoxylon trugodes]|uniref:beta-lactamase family protein n=1 Tax=Hypoxylon trugodes TaxID=326681 RepID=UPI002190AE25|nr:beta-lactamase family protein [Hypoxylon trugodes]KAI1388267.1 beta-lactamase family protein [Hypoxylon trugodes]